MASRSWSSACVLPRLLGLAVALFLVCRPLEAWSQSRAAAPKAAPTQTMGSLQGAFTVTDRGNSSYAIDIPTPPGTNELQPKLSLVYNNATGNGMVGVGWSLAGLVSIDRTGANLAQDGFRGGVTYGADDRFTYNGQRLIMVETNADGAVFRTEVESWTRIVSHARTDAGATCGNGPCWWTVTTDKGLTYELGRTADSRAAPRGGDGSIRSWSLGKIVDLNGNVLTVTYTATPYSGSQDGGQIYPARIDYTSNPAAGLTAQRAVTFSYEARPDPIGIYIGGYPVRTAARLKRVDSSVDGVKTPSIILTYAQSPATGRSQVTQIAECTGDDSQCLVPTNFAWSSADLSFAAPAGWLSTDFTQGWTAQDPRLLADVNGDGLADVVGIRLDTQVALAKPDRSFAGAATWNAGFGRNTGWTDARTPRTVGDVNGDGLLDVVGFNYKSVEVALSTGHSFDKAGWTQPSYPYFGFDPSAGGWIKERNPRLLADVNGDGLADIVGFGAQTMVGLSNGAGFETPAVWNTSDFTGDAWWRQTERLRLIGDVNGDGRADIVAFSSTGVVVGISTGGQTNQFDLSRWPQNTGGYAYFSLAQGWRSDLHPRLLVDVNGDGLADIVGFKNGVQVALSTGKGFMPPQTWNAGFSAESSPPWRAGTTRLLIDVDGDHRADIVGFDTTGAKVALNRGDIFTDGLWNASALAGFTPSTDRPVQTSDVNGDGLGDAVAFGANRGQATTLAVGLAGGAQADMIVQVTNGLGGRLDLTYAPLSDRGVYTPAASSPGGQAAAGLTSFVQPQPYIYSPYSAAYPLRDIVGGPIYVIKHVDESIDRTRSAASYNYSTDYSYTDAKLDQRSQRWLGFASKTRLYLEDGRKTVEIYNQTFPLTGTLQRREIRCGPKSSDPLCVPDALITSAPMEYIAVQTATGVGPIATPVWDVRKTRQTVNQYVYGQFDTATLNVFAYDAFGQPVLQSYIGRVDQAGKDLSPDDDVYACKRYVNDATRWRLGYLDALKFSSTSDCGVIDQFRPGVDLSLTTYAYDQATFELAGKKMWDDQAKAFQVITYGHDAYGNQTSMVDPVGQLWKTEFDPKFHTFLQTLRGPPLAGGRTFATQYNYDPRFGLQTAEVDANGNVNLTCYDGLGREVGRQVNAPSGVPADTSCVTAGPGSGVSVITNRATDWLIGAGHETYSETRTLQDWPTSQGQKTWLYARQTLDGRARIYRSVRQGAAAGADVVDCTVYDGYDRTPSRSLPFFGAASADCAATASGRLWLDQRYDIIGRIVERTRPEGPNGGGRVRDVTSYPSYLRAVQTLAVGTPEAYVREFRYDMRKGDKVTVAVSVTSDGGATTQIGRDRLGAITATVSPPTAASPAGVRTSYLRDSLGRIVRTDSPDRGVVTNDYLGTPYLKKQTTTNGVETFDYDTQGRLLRHDLGGGFVYAFSYDDTTVTNGVGRQTGLSATDPRLAAPIVQTIGYDAQGNPSSVTTIGLPNLTAPQVQTTAYDPQSRPRVLSLPNGARLERAYQYGLLAYLKLDSLTVARFTGYSPYAKPTGIAYDGGVVETLGYTPSGLLSSQKVTQAAATYLDRAYDWSPLDELRAMREAVRYSGKDLSETYGYDNLRLTSAEGVFGKWGYAYDQAGNLNQRTDQASGVKTDYAYRNFQLLKGVRGGAEIYAADYDAFGSMTRRASDGDVQVFGYDPEARLTSSKDGGGVERARFHYDAQGERMLVDDRVTGVTTAYVSPTYQVATKGGQALSTVVLHDDLGPLAMVTTGSASVTGPGVPGPGVLHLHRNQVGSTTLTTRGTGAVGSVLAYEPYGVPIRLNGPDDFSNKFAGLLRDEATSLYYSASRYLDPQTGRFTTADAGPSAEPQIQDSLNTYAYVAGRPTSLVDPSGQFLPLIAAAIAEVGAAAAEGAAVAAEGAALGAEAGATVGEAAAAGTAALSETVAAESTAATTAATVEAEVTETTALASRAAMTGETATASTSSAVSGEAAVQSTSLESGSLADVTAFEGEGSLTQCPSPCRAARWLWYEYSPWSTRPVTLFRGLRDVGEIGEIEGTGTLRSPFWRANGIGPGADRFTWWRMWLHSIDSGIGPSPYVSTTSSESVAQSFSGGGGRIYRFTVPRYTVNRAWWSPFPHEFEYLAKDGQVVQNVVRTQ
ncbi:FG-GAP-like repeat-containing protein [Caulobacter segnis]|uniref:Teneurin-like YD-shell domain-containing protein n=1 Tax=Caulobacter segnis TaxID=88688 RepID=A0A2W5X2G6_9CAUL|nr:FG-GAP-like repeat-containing protein [Caulobacter segnis]PZR34754.1 MAG: hypothetical protein DI526_09480 [Caulobacter segnis]